MESPLVVSVGACNIDLISYLDCFPKPGETIAGNSFSIGFGGKGANQCVAAAKLGIQTALIAKLGNDTHGKDYLHNLKKNNINVDHVKIVDGLTTGVAPIMVNNEGENAIVIVSGANLHLNQTDILDAEELIQKSKVLLCQREILDETTKEAMKLAKKYNVMTILNASPIDSKIDKELLPLADVLCVNKTEAEMLVAYSLNSEVDVKKASKDLLDKGCKNVIITLGEKGAFLAYEGYTEMIPAPPAENVVDTTGAGDAFAGALGFFIASLPNLSMRDAIERSYKIACITVQRKGTQTSFPSAEEL